MGGRLCVQVREKKATSSALYTNPFRRHRAFRGCGNARWSRQSKTGLLALRPILGSVHGQVKEPARFACRDQHQLGELLVNETEKSKCSGSREATLLCHPVEKRHFCTRLSLSTNRNDGRKSGGNFAGSAES